MTFENKNSATQPLVRILVTGASGFAGSHIIEGLLTAGYSVRGLSRSIPAANRKNSQVDYIVKVDVGDKSTMTPAMFKDISAIIHLVGIIQETKNGQTFQRIHVDGTRNVVEIAKSAGFNGRFIYMSAIGASADAPAEYSRTKYAAEQIVISSGFPYTILRPSLIMGKDGEFVAQMAELVRYGGLPVKIPFPVIPVPGSGNNKFQPIYIDDLTACVVKALQDNSTANQIYEIGGATQVSFNELIRGFSHSLKVRKPMVHAPSSMLKVVAGVMESIMPKPPVTRDQLANLGRDNVTQSKAITEVFGVLPLAFDGILERIYSS